MVKEVDIPSNRLISGIALEGGSPLARRKAAKRDIKAAAACQKEKRARGLPPWAAIDEGTDATHTGLLPHQSSVLKSSKTLREWADEYCATDKLLKEFTYEKVHTALPFATITERSTERSALTGRVRLAPRQPRSRHFGRYQVHVLYRSVRCRVPHDQREDHRAPRQPALAYTVQQVAQIHTVRPALIPLYLAVQALWSEGRRTMGSLRWCVCPEDMATGRHAWRAATSIPAPALLGRRCYYTR